MEKAKAEGVELTPELADRDEKVRVLTDELQAYLDAGDSEQQVKFAQLREQIRVLESQVNEQMMKADSFNRECKALRKQLGKAHEQN